jgi:beta-xylosidase
MALENPIIPGFAPDPSVCLIGDTFYLVNSSFHVFPGLPIYTSKDLKSWEYSGTHTLPTYKREPRPFLPYLTNTPLGNAINRPSQLSLNLSSTTLIPWHNGTTHLAATGGLFAPTIRHHAASGKTYIACTNICRLPSGGDKSDNFIIWTSDIRSGIWSDPAVYDFEGIDPSILFDVDEDGTEHVYVQGSKSADHQIWNMEIDLDTGAMVTEAKMIWDGWDSRWTEGPHVYKKDGWYYLVCAEGGTFEEHMVTAARSRSVWGPYVASEANPVWTAYETGNYVQHTGHAELFQDLEGKWWVVLLGVRKSDGDRYTMGRETFLAEVDWPEGGWPSVKSFGQTPSGALSVPGIGEEGVEWLYLRDADASRYKMDGAKIVITASDVELTDPNQSPSFVGKRQRRLDGACQVQLHLPDPSEILGTNLKAGLALYKDEHRFLEVGIRCMAGVMETYGSSLNKAKNIDGRASVIAEQASQGVQAIGLKIEYTEMEYIFSFRPGSTGNWTELMRLDTADLSGLDFVGPVIGLFAVGDGKTLVRFSEFTMDSTFA